MQLAGVHPWLCLQEEHILPYCVPFLRWLLRGQLSPPRWTHSTAPCFALPSTALNTKGCAQATHLTKPALPQELGYGCSCAAAQGTGGSRANQPLTEKQTALASGEMKLLKISAFVSQHHFLVFVLPHSTLTQKSKWWHSLGRKASQKNSRNLSFVSQNRIFFFCFSSDLWFLGFLERGDRHRLLHMTP